MSGAGSWSSGASSVKSEPSEGSRRSADSHKPSVAGSGPFSGWMIDILEGILVTDIRKALDKDLCPRSMALQSSIKAMQDEVEIVKQHVSTDMHALEKNLDEVTDRVRDIHACLTTFLQSSGPTQSHNNAEAAGLASMTQLAQGLTSQHRDQEPANDNVGMED